jgi:pimeloyl-ACP methyl ester carboxylesterase
VLRTWLRRFALALAVGLGAVVLVLVVWGLLPASTPAIPGERAIAALERIPLGGFRQTVLLRGQDTRKPVLLYLHGGPGMGMLPVARHMTAGLEADFLTVHWDQRGAGASCAGVDWSTLTLERMLGDTIELSEHLVERFGRPIFLLGHSWGSVIGALAVQQRPELFAAYIGLGQLVHGRRNEQLSHAFTLAEARRRGDAEAIAQLESVQPPYPNNAALGTQRRWLVTYGGTIYDTARAREALPAMLFGREWTLATRLGAFPCFDASTERLWSSVDSVDFLTSIPRLEVPVLLFSGRHDYNTPFTLTEEWAARLEAPHVQVVWLEDVAHMAPLEAPEAFQAAIREELAPFVR